MLLILIGTLSIGSMNVMASQSQKADLGIVVDIESVSIDRQPSNLLAGIGTMSVNKNLVVGNTSVPLYATFDSQEAALQNISTNPVVQEIKLEYGYEDISDDNWKDYYDAMHELIDLPSCPDWYNEEAVSFRTMRKFFDIYENHEKNEEIVSLVTRATAATDITENADLLELLPYDSYIALSQQSNISNNERSLASLNALGFNINAAVAYASKYAKSPNTDDYDKFSSDCTNFVSQILENGGVSQVKYDDQKKGWWHTKSKVLYITVHKHSISWIRANTFAKYMGVGYTTTNNSLFSANIKKGDFIAADYEKDGDWNHMGFVTSKKTSKTNGYYDYKVAQHTKNYHAWASSSTNSWEKIGKDGGKYGRVRR